MLGRHSTTDLQPSPLHPFGIGFAYRIKVMDLVLFFYLHLSSFFPASFGPSFPSCRLGTFEKKKTKTNLDVCISVGFFSPGPYFFSIGLCVLGWARTVPVLFLWLCSIVWDQILLCLQHCSFYSVLCKLFGVLCVCMWICRDSLPSSVKH